jgi:2-(1,2-epoxy-1,2-dihydrophenyl)acetyl-CoA isomerase
MSGDLILFERDGPVARLTLNRPDAANSINLPLAQALLDAVIACDEDRGVRAVLLTGAGRFFCAGGDVGAFGAAGDDLPQKLKQITACLHMAVSRLARMSKPLVVAVNGAAAGAGVGLAVLGDIVLAAQSAHFTMAYSALGVSPDGGATWLLPRLIGLRRTQELYLTNRRVGSREAQDIDLVTRVVADDSLAAEAAATAATLAGSAGFAVGRTRNLLLASLSESLESQLEAEARAISDCARSPQGREGVAAFVGKRKPDFGASGG